jgi:hypothetical protein
VIITWKYFVENLLSAYRRTLDERRPLQPLVTIDRGRVRARLGTATNQEAFHRVTPAARAAKAGNRPL